MQSVTYRRPHLYPKQAAFVDSTARYVIVEASTKTGKTIGMLVWLFEQALQGGLGDNYWWVAPSRVQAKIALKRLKLWLRLVKPLWTPNDTELTLELANGATLHFKTAADADRLYGDDVRAAVMDEATRIREDSWHAVRSTLTATRGKLRVIGNVKGSKNWAFKLARAAEGGATDMEYFRLTAYDAVEGGVLTKEEVEDARRVLPEHVFNELYLAIPTEDGSNPFGVHHINAIAAAHRELFGLELAPGPLAVRGLDLARGGPGNDFSVLVGLNGAGQTAEFDRWQGTWEHTNLKVKALPGRIPMLADSTGAGDAPVERMQREVGAHIEPFTFSASSKQKLMEGLAVAIQQHELTIPPDGPLHSELLSFEYVVRMTNGRVSGVTYSAPEGENYHDDCVMALALAVEKRGRPQVGASWAQAWRQMAKPKEEAA